MLVYTAGPPPVSGTALPSCTGLVDLSKSAPFWVHLPPPAPLGIPLAACWTERAGPGPAGVVAENRGFGTRDVNWSLCSASDQLLNFPSLAVPPSSVKWETHG